MPGILTGRDGARPPGRFHPRNRLIFLTATQEMAGSPTTISRAAGRVEKNVVVQEDERTTTTTDRVISRRDLALSIRPPFFTGDIQPGRLIPGHASQNLNLAGKWTTCINPVGSARAGNAANIFRGQERASERTSGESVRGGQPPLFS